jgi:hypothetical protein
MSIWEDDYYADYYGHGANPSTRNNYGSGTTRSIGYNTGRGTYGNGSHRSYGNWDWGNYGYSSIKEEDDELFIANHDSYFTPTTFEVESRLPYGNNMRTKDNIKVVKELSRFYFHKMLDEKDYIDPEYKATGLNEEQQELVDQKTPFYEDLWDKYIPGFTPLEKALALFNQMMDNHKSNGGDESEFGEAFNDDTRAQLDDVKFDEEIWNDPEYNELLDLDFFKARNFDKVSIMNKISLIQNLGSQFKIEKEVTEKIVQNSQLISKKMMRDYSQVFNVDLYQRLFPDFDMKLLTKNLTINVPVDRTEHKQKIIMLLDFSGSMSNSRKQEWVVAILMDRLKHCMLEEAEVFFSYFCHRATDMHFTHVYNRATALEFLNTFSTSPDGGDTHIGDMIDFINNQINNRGRLHNLDIDLSEDQPEILVINDGDDSIKTSEFSYKTNAISLYRTNAELKGLCIKNKGKYVTVEASRNKHGNRDGNHEKVNTYSVEGNEILTL